MKKKLPEIDLPNQNPADVEKFLKLNPGTFDHIPHYAREGALDAIRHVMELEERQLFRPGLYYILLSDLCRSTEASLHLGAELNRLRVETFILNCIEALGSIELENYAMFLREIGDAVLIIFSSFRDILEWYMTMRGLGTLFPNVICIDNPLQPA
jgi:hypothetical protein